MADCRASVDQLSADTSTNILDETIHKKHDPDFKNHIINV